MTPRKHSKKCAWLNNRCDCDEYHTFGELYEHRLTLFIQLCRFMLKDSETAYKYEEPRDIYYRNGCIWRSQLHSDGTSFNGWFVMGIRTDLGKQITYHIPIDRWDETDFAQTLEKAPEFDGHTSDDVLVRLKTL